MSRKHKKVCTTLNYIKHFLILPSKITGCISEIELKSKCLRKRDMIK